jgi:drug/metabolite transporter (DMT)-like permease
MGVLLGLVAALCWGTSDFLGGFGGRRSDPVAMTVAAQPVSALAAVIALAVWPARHDPTLPMLAWGLLGGVGSGVGMVSLYRGLAVARMSVVAPTSAVVSAALPALTGIAQGDRLSAGAWAGVAVAMPAIALVSAQSSGPGGSRRAGVITGLVAGAGFGTLFISMAEAGTSAGAWPLIPCQAVSLVVVFGWAAAHWPPRTAWPTARRIGLVGGSVSGLANLAYLAATGHGQLAVVAVVTALYPAATVLSARFVLHEHWSRWQAAGLLVAAAAITSISLG